MEEQFRALLTGHAPLTALVGQRIYWDEIPQSASRPCVVMHVVSSTPTYHMKGEDGLRSCRVQIDCQATTIASKWAVARAVEGLLSGYRGVVNGVEFSGIFKSLDRDKTERTTPDDTIKIRQQDYEIWAKSVQ